MIHSRSFPQGVRVNKGPGREGVGMNRVFTSLIPLVPKENRKQAGAELCEAQY